MGFLQALGIRDNRLPASHVSLSLSWCADCPVSTPMVPVLSCCPHLGRALGPLLSNFNLCLLVWLLPTVTGPLVIWAPHHPSLASPAHV